LSRRKEANNKLGGPLSFFFLLATGGQKSENQQFFALPKSAVQTQFLV
jgi:hypothetical protein